MRRRSSANRTAATKKFPKAPPRAKQKHVLDFLKFQNYRRWRQLGASPAIQVPVLQQSLALVRGQAEVRRPHPLSPCAPARSHPPPKRY